MSKCVIEKVSRYVSTVCKAAYVGTGGTNRQSLFQLRRDFSNVNNTNSVAHIVSLVESQVSSMICGYIILNSNERSFILGCKYRWNT